MAQETENGLADFVSGLLLCEVPRKGRFGANGSRKLTRRSRATSDVFKSEISIPAHVFSHYSLDGGQHETAGRNRAFIPTSATIGRMTYSCTRPPAAHTEPSSLSLLMEISLLPVQGTHISAHIRGNTSSSAGFGILGCLRLQ